MILFIINESHMTNFKKIHTHILCAKLKKNCKYLLHCKVPFSMSKLFLFSNNSSDKRFIVQFSHSILSTVDSCNGHF